MQLRRGLELLSDQPIHQLEGISTRESAEFHEKARQVVHADDQLQDSLESRPIQHMLNILEPGGEHLGRWVLCIIKYMSGS